MLRRISRLTRTPVPHQSRPYISSRASLKIPSRNVHLQTRAISFSTIPRMMARAFRVPMYGAAIGAGGLGYANYKLEGMMLNQELSSLAKGSQVFETRPRTSSRASLTGCLPYMTKHRALSPPVFRPPPNSPHKFPPNWPHHSLSLQQPCRIQQKVLAEARKSGGML